MAQNFVFLLPVYQDVIDTPTGYIPHIGRDVLQRITFANGTIRDGFYGGSLTTPRSRRVMAQKYGLIPGHDDAGHIIPQSMGGSGQNVDNLFAQLEHVNRSRGAFEGQLGRLLMMDTTLSIRFLMVFIYTGNNLRADGYVFICQVFQNGLLENTYADVVPN